ncbi:MAG: 30S ribosomal protein S14 [Rickettsia sp.]|nr:30S ribosomal protein S14 [Rickettsia sp.]
MAKVSLIERNKKRKMLSKKFSSLRERLKKEIYKKDLALDVRLKLIFKLAELPRNSSRVRVRNLCAVTGRPRGFYRKLGLSRNIFREYAAQGILPGIVKASW